MARKLLICSVRGDGIAVIEQPIAPIRPDLLALFERSELEKYLMPDELPPEQSQAPQQGGTG